MSTESRSIESTPGKVAVQGGIVLYLKKNKSLAALRPGDRILLKIIPERIRNAGNPGEWDQARQWLFKGVTHRAYADSDQYQILNGSAQGYALLRWVSRLRHYILNRLQKHLQDPQVNGLAAALLIGYRQELDASLSQSYSNTGVIHIIAISGLHLALIGWMLEKMLRPFQKKRFGIFFSQLLLLSTIWTFSLLAESTPSVLRAALLFSVQGLGIFLHRKGNSLNTLAAAAFILLCYNPFWLWDLGFQLSFIAVLSILLIGRPLSRIFSRNNTILHQLGQLIAISLAAQTLTTPFTLYYFHQFPASFLLSNLIAVPLSSIILGGELLLCLVADIPFMGNLIGLAVEGMIRFMNHYIRWVEQIPGLIWKQLYWSVPETILLLAGILSLMHWLLNRSAVGRRCCLLAGSLLLFLQIQEKLKRPHQNLLVVYHTRSHTVIDLIQGESARTLLDSAGLFDSSLQKFLLEPAHQHFRVLHAEQMALPVSFQYKELRILRPDKNFRPPWVQPPFLQPSKSDSVKPMPVYDLLLITRHAPYHPEDWLKGLTVKRAIIDATCGARTSQQWEAALDSLQIQFHVVKKQGAFVHSFQ